MILMFGKTCLNRITILLLAYMLNRKANICSYFMAVDVDVVWYNVCCSKTIFEIRILKTLWLRFWNPESFSILESFGSKDEWKKIHIKILNLAIKKHLYNGMSRVSDYS